VEKNSLEKVKAFTATLCNRKSHATLCGMQLLSWAAWIKTLNTPK